MRPMPLPLVSVIDYRPAIGGGSCAHCGASLGLASLKLKDVWYCSSGCSEGRSASVARSARVPEPWLYTRPWRHYRRRKPRELRSTRRES
jgi:hypothetical protein